MRISDWSSDVCSSDLLDEGLRALALQLRGQCVDIDAGRGDLLQRGRAVAAVLGHRAAHLAVVGEGAQGLLRHRVDSGRRGQRLDVERVRRLQIGRASWRGRVCTDVENAVGAGPVQKKTNLMKHYD